MEATTRVSLGWQINQLLKLPDRFIELGIPLRIGPADLAEARAEVEAVRAWFADEAGSEVDDEE